ncbi:helix-turn-helix domain-containing protein [Gracilibacillus phocaeensis]|uniref:helix-turn-helix domain-containing protein n=1 Tax=Gracilibacillus phocaeensis TaxID=2042304 RepID=UPI0010314709|nr:helix-turn-helix domain-containing protein [Gracilibacillus phocaeensis]
MKETYQTVIRQKLVEQNISMRQLAKQTNINVSTISRIINGKRQATLQHLQSIAAVLNLPLTDLVEKKPEEAFISLAHVRGIIYDMKLPVEDISEERLKDTITEYQQKSNTPQGKTKILQQFKEKLSSIQGQGPMVEQLESMYIAFKEGKRPRSELLLMGSALFYFITSIDILPDYLIPVGYLDDALVIQYVLQSMSVK